MNQSSFRNALGISALTAFSLVMIGCGGSSSSAPTASNAAPGSVTISGANTAVTAHSSIYNLSAVDPEGDAITFSTTTAGATISGSVLTFTPTVVAPASAPAIISVIATDSKGSRFSRQDRFGGRDGECGASLHQRASDLGSGGPGFELHPDHGFGSRG
ncbi:MAG: hypothetical protein IPP78_07000 [Holophagaceae bacterium]|nr:hypothetical protein [Holophagaceae bacterium]